MDEQPVQAPDESDLTLFDDEDVETVPDGQEPPESDELSDEELAAVRASQADPETAAADDPEVG